MNVDLAAFKHSADGHKYYLVAAVTVEINKGSKLLPIFVVPMPQKDSVSGLAAIKEALTLCNDRNLRQIRLENCPHTGGRWRRIQQPEAQGPLL